MHDILILNWHTFILVSGNFLISWKLSHTNSWVYSNCFSWLLRWSPIIKNTNITLDQSTERLYKETRAKHYAKYSCNHHKWDASRISLSVNLSLGETITGGRLSLTLSGWMMWVIHSNGLDKEGLDPGVQFAFSFLHLVYEMRDLETQAGILCQEPIWYLEDK